MFITRRQFLKYCAASAAALGLSQTDLLKLEKALADCNCFGVPRVIWLQGQSCGGCTLSILNRIMLPDDNIPELAPGTGAVQDVVDLLVGDAVQFLTDGTTRSGWAAFPNGYICLDYQSVVMAGAGDIINDHITDVRAEGGYIVAVSGAIPLKDQILLNKSKDPRYCIVGELALPGLDTRGKVDRSITELLEWLAGPAAAVVSFGTCASYGGIPAAARNKTKATSVYNFLVNYQGHNEWAGKILNIPGCAPHPDWMIYPIAHFILHSALPALDTNPVYTNPGFTQPLNRPRAIYTGDKGYGVFCQEGICPKYDPTGTKNCHDLGAGPGNGDGSHEKEWCTRLQGCNGYMASPDCPTRRWNNFNDGTRNQWCVGTLPQGPNYVCQGCAEPDYPDGRSPFFEADKNGDS